MRMRPVFWSCLFFAIAGASSRAQHSQEPVTDQAVLNVVLLELDTSSEVAATQPRAIANDWSHWRQTAGALVTFLELRLGYTATGAGGQPQAMLFCLRSAIDGFEDTERMADLIGKLDSICETTKRPSFVLVWLPQEGCVFLLWHDRGEMSAAAAMAMLSRMHTAMAEYDFLGAAANPYIAPPCLLASSAAHRSRATTAELRDLLGPSQLDAVGHAIRAAEREFLLTVGVLVLAKATPAGATLLRDNAEFMTKFGDGLLKSATPQNWMWKGLQKTGTDFCSLTAGALSTLKFEAGGRADLGSKQWRVGGSLRLCGDMGPGGILLVPKLEVMVDRTGLTSALASKAVAAVKGKVSGELAEGDQRYLAVKTPGTANLFNVAAGEFRLVPVDVVPKTPGRVAIPLCRYYESASQATSALGPGWSFAPYSLELSERSGVGATKEKAARSLALIDRQAGAHLPYRLEEQRSVATQPSEVTPVSRYVKVNSSLQPDLEPQAGGGYVVRFAHGFQTGFDAAGRLVWMEQPQDSRVEYVYEGDLLKELRAGSECRITLVYDSKGRLSGAKATGGESVRYVLDDSGRLVNVVGSEGGDQTYTYGDDGRLATVRRSGGQEASNLVAANTYDDRGRMLTHRTPAGEWRFAYDDQLGRAVPTGPDGKTCEYYYDAFQRLVAYGSVRNKMTLLNYDVTGRILQVADAEMLNEPRGAERPRFRVVQVVAPLPPSSIPRETKG